MQVYTKHSDTGIDVYFIKNVEDMLAESKDNSNYIAEK